MVEALKSRYWSLRNKLDISSYRRALQAGGPSDPAEYARVIRLGLTAVRLDSTLRGLLARHARNRRLLYMASIFPPQVSGGVYRPTALFKYGAGRAWRTTVFAGPRPEPPSAAGNFLRAQIPKEVEVIHLPDLYVPSRSRRRPHPRLPRIDFGMANVLEAYWRAAEHFASEPPEVILASGPHFHNFLAATLLARRFRARLVLEYRDEWSENPFDWVDKHPQNRLWESQCLRHADLVIFTTQSQLDHQVTVFPTLDRRRCTVIPNGWDPEDFQQTELIEQKISEDKLTIGFFGNFGAMGDPVPFLNDLAQVLSDRPDLRSKFRLRVVGQKTDGARAALRSFPWQDCLSLEDQISKVEACREMKRVDYLLLMNPPELERYIQGKLFDYLSSSSPILVYGAGGEAEAIVNQCGTGVFVAEGNLSRLSELLEKKVMLLARSGRSEQWLKEHRRDHLARMTIETLNRAAAQ